MLELKIPFLWWNGPSSGEESPLYPTYTFLQSRLFVIFGINLKYGYILFDSSSDFFVKKSIF